MEVESGNPYREILGPRFDDLAPNVRLSLCDPVCAHGIATVWGASSRLGRWLAPRLGLPPEAVRVDLFLEMHWTSMGFQWTRLFDGLVLMSYQESRDGFLVETVGNLTLWFQIDVEDGALVYVLAGTRWRGLRLPRALSPCVSARAWQNGTGWGVEVDVRAPILGRLCRYKTKLEFL